jgi:hypothetical protein
MITDDGKRSLKRASSINALKEKNKSRKHKCTKRIRRSNTDASASLNIRAFAQHKNRILYIRSFDVSIHYSYVLWKRLMVAFAKALIKQDNEAICTKLLMFFFSV